MSHVFAVNYKAILISATSSGTKLNSNEDAKLNLLSLYIYIYDKN